ncbi:ABC transporter ATP-binding protein [Piscinibacter sp.]|uniref:ABC transporter ATP-binding protein n=1 Tax=Piscinibacter sp. TaxID=1903157 RepID=UPI0039E3BDBD
MTTPIVSMHGVHKRFDSGVQALAGVELQLAPGEFVALLGPSGCGKSTVLRLAAGLDTPGAGRIDSPALRSGAADTAFVFQDATLMPWASVADNVWLPLRLAGRSRAQARPRIEAALATVGLSAFAGAFPNQLSGGMKMRVSIARALVTQPALLLMDEPFAALDEITRQKLNADLLAAWGRQGFAALFVTHSVYEAVFLAQRVLVMSARPGRIVFELAIAAPHPRDAAFRRSSTFVDACAALSAALEASHAA